MGLPRYIQKRGKRYRVVFPKALLRTRFAGSRATLEAAVELRDEKLNAMGQPIPRANGENVDNPEAGDDAGPKITQEERLNELILTAKYADLHTLDELLDACNVDRNVWRVQRHLVNKWEGFAKLEETDLEYLDGAATGHVRKKGLIKVPLWQVKAWLVRQEPIAIFPTVQPVECATLPAPRPREDSEGLRRTLIVCDPHFGFYLDGQVEMEPLHDSRALSIVIQVAQAAGVDRVDVLGDLLDLADWSSHFIRSPEFVGCTQAAVIAAHQWFSQLRQALPDADIRAHEGNHGKRLRDALATNLLAAYDLRAADEMELPPAMSIPRLLAFHRLGVEWVGGYPGDDDWLNDRVRLSHGERVNSGPGDTAKIVVLDSDVVEVFGHCHRQELASRTMHTRRGAHVIQAFSPGCTCHIDGRVPAKTSRQQWQQGIAVVDYEPMGKKYGIAPILIENGSALWNGMHFTAEADTL